MRVSPRGRDAVKGAVGKYQPVFVIRHFRDGSASRVTGLRRCTIYVLTVVSTVQRRPWFAWFA